MKPRKEKAPHPTVQLRERAHEVATRAPRSVSDADLRRLIRLASAELYRRAVHK